MAMQAGLSVSKIVLLVGTGYTGTILFQNGKLSDIIGHVQSYVKSLENSGDSVNADDPVANQVRWLAEEVRRLASARQITVVNGNGDRIDITSYAGIAAVVGGVGYVYMKWKGLCFSDLMYVTKKNMANAVANLTKHLESVSEALAKTKRHLTQRIESMDGKIDEQRELSKIIMNEVQEARGDLSKLNHQIYSLTNTVHSLDEKMASFADVQDRTLLGVGYLCRVADGKADSEVPGLSQYMQEQMKLHGKSYGQLRSTATLGLQGIRELAEGLISGPDIKLLTDGDSEPIDLPKRTLMRTTSARCPNF